MSICVQLHLHHYDLNHTLTMKQFLIMKNHQTLYTDVISLDALPLLHHVFQPIDHNHQPLHFQFVLKSECVVVVCLGNGCVSYYVYYLHGYMLMSDYVNLLLLLLLLLPYKWSYYHIRRCTCVRPRLLLGRGRLRN